MKHSLVGLKVKWVVLRRFCSQLCFEKHVRWDKTFSKKGKKMINWGHQTCTVYSQYRFIIINLSFYTIHINFCFMKLIMETLKKFCFSVDDLLLNIHFIESWLYYWSSWGLFGKLFRLLSAFQHGEKSFLILSAFNICEKSFSISSPNFQVLRLIV